MAFSLFLDEVVSLINLESNGEMDVVGAHFAIVASAAAAAHITAALKSRRLINRADQRVMYAILALATVVSTCVTLLLPGRRLLLLLQGKDDEYRLLEEAAGEQQQAQNRGLQPMMIVAATIASFAAQAFASRTNGDNNGDDETSGGGGLHHQLCKAATSRADNLDKRTLPKFGAPLEPLARSRSWANGAGRWAGSTGSSSVPLRPLSDRRRVPLFGLAGQARRGEAAANISYSGSNNRVPLLFAAAAAEGGEPATGMATAVASEDNSGGGDDGSSSRAVGPWVKLLAFCSLVANDTAVLLLIRASKLGSGPRYLNSTAVFLGQLVKTVLNLLILFGCEGWRGTRQQLYEGVVQSPKEILRMAVPSLLFVIQGNLFYLALDSLDTVVYLLCKQTKILTTAAMSILVLGRRLMPQQWLALTMLVSGMSVVQYSQLQGGAIAAGAAATGSGSPLLGILAVLGANICSGYGGLYYEKVLKTQQNEETSGDEDGQDVQQGQEQQQAKRRRKKMNSSDVHASPSGLAVRNLQLLVLSIPISVATMWAQDSSRILANGFFSGYSWLVWAVILLMATGEILNSVVVNYMDCIVKNIASSYTVLCSLFMEILLFGFRPSPVFLTGGSIVMTSTGLYSQIISVEGLWKRLRACLPFKTSGNDPAAAESPTVAPI